MQRKFILISIISTILLSGCASSDHENNSITNSTVSSIQNDTVDSTSNTEPSTTELYAMDTYMTLTAYGNNSKQALEKATDTINELDALLSTGNKNSEIYKLNKTGEGTLSDTAFYLLNRSLEINKITDGAFNPTVYPLMELWGFTTKKYNVPSEDKINSLLPLTDVSNINIDQTNKMVKFDTQGMEIDFGGIAKGFTSAKIMDIFRQNGITSGMVSLGGNVQVLGKKPDGSLWRVAVQDPNSDDDYLGVLETSDKAIITSGGYERYFEKNGKTYHHILDPKTGSPADSDLTSVTIVSSDGTLADGYSTSLFVMGLDKSIDFWRKNANDFDAILYTKNGELYVTEGISDSFTSDKNFETVRKEID